MSLTDTIRGLVLKNPKADPRRKSEPLRGGRRKGEEENPYITARRTWNDHVASQVAARKTWQMLAILSLMIVLVAVGGVIQIGSQSKFIPYVVQVDKLGQAAAAGPVSAASPTDKRVIHAAVAQFIVNARTVTPDVALQRKAVFGVYAMLSPTDPATAKMNEWLNGDNGSSPFERAAKEMVNVEITAVMPQTPDTWEVDWTETTRDRQGVMKGSPVNMRALITVYTAETTPNTSEQQLRMNPLSIYVRNYSWSRLL